MLNRQTPSTGEHMDRTRDGGRLHPVAPPGITHSVEAYFDNQLVGGLYGLAIGRAFFGESMFHQLPEASKVCMNRLVEISLTYGIDFIDCQVSNPFSRPWEPAKFQEPFF